MRVVGSAGNRLAVSLGGMPHVSACNNYVGQVKSLGGAGAKRRGVLSRGRAAGTAKLASRVSSYAANPYPYSHILWLGFPKILILTTATKCRILQIERRCQLTAAPANLTDEMTAQRARLWAVYFVCLVHQLATQSYYFLYILVAKFIFQPLFKRLG